MDDESPVPASPQSETLRLQAEANRNRIDFLRTELEMSFTLAGVAEVEQERGESHATQALRDAETGYATLLRFMSDPKHSKHIIEQDRIELATGMERLRAKLDSLAARSK